MNGAQSEPGEDHKEQVHTQPQISNAYLEDWNLVQRCVGGDREAWVCLVERYESTIYYTVLHALRSRGSDAPEDLVSDLQADILVALVKDNFRKLRRYSGRCKLNHWLKVVSGHFTIDYLRQKRPSVSFDDPAPAARSVIGALQSSSPSVEEAMNTRQQMNLLRELCATLPAEDRRFVELYFRKEMSFEEVAAEMNTTLGAVYARKNRIRKKLLESARRRKLL